MSEKFNQKWLISTNHTQKKLVFLWGEKEKKEKQAWIFKIVLGDPKTSAHLRLKATALWGHEGTAHSRGPGERGRMSVGTDTQVSE